MRLALVYHQLVPAGGLENYLIEFARRLTAAGHELQFITARINNEVASKLQGEVRMLPNAKGPASLRLLRFDIAAARAAAELSVDAVLGFGRTTRQDVHRAGGGCHALYSRLLPFWKRLSLKNQLELSLERRLYTGGGTRAFVTNSDQVAIQLSETYGVPAEQLTTIHTAVETALFRPPADRAAVREAMRRQMHTGLDDPVFLFVSLNHRRKGLDALLQALAQVEKGVLWIVGKPLDLRWLARIRHLKIGHRLRVVPQTQQIVRLYQAADWFAHPTLYDACANTVLQSMACGLPGLISTRDGAIDHIEDGVTGLLLPDPENVVAVAERLRVALALPEDARAGMGRAASAAMQKLTWEKHVGEWEALLRKVRASRDG